MPTISWVTGTTPVTVSSVTSISATSPAGIADGDGLFAFVVSYQTATPPAGWTLVDSHSTIYTPSTLTQTIQCFKKDTVTALDSSTSFTWTYGSSGSAVLAFAVLRASFGAMRVRGVGKANIDNVATNNITLPTAGVLERTGGVYLAIGSTVLATTSNYLPTAPAGYTRWNASYANNRMTCAYAVRSAGESNQLSSMTLVASASNNSVAAIVLRVESTLDQSEMIQGAGVGVVLDPSGSTYGADATDGVGMRGGVILGDQLVDELIDAVGMAGVLFDSQPVPEALTDGVGVADPAVGVRAVTAETTAEVSFSESTSIWWGLLLRDTIRVAEAYVAGRRSGATLQDLMATRDLLRVGAPVAAEDAVQLAQVLAASLGVRVAEALGLQLVSAQPVTRGVTTTDNIRMLDALRRFLSGDALDTVGMTTTVLPGMRFAPVASDGIGLEAIAGERFILRVNAADTINISPEQALQMLFRPSLQDGVELSAAYVSPDGSVTTWAVNTRNGAVSEYRNYAFNSFAASGTKYLAASDTGLYELNGDTDAGTDIIGSLKSGFLSFAGSRFSGFKAAYIGVRGPGDYVFRLTTADNKSYTYAVNVRRMETTKILLGKGIRSSYFAFELISTGQDFDLDFVELVPARAGRRV